jgi:hypothetical protein
VSTVDHLEDSVLFNFSLLQGKSSRTRTCRVISGGWAVAEFIFAAHDDAVILALSVISMIGRSRQCSLSAFIDFKRFRWAMTMSQARSKCQHALDFVGHAERFSWEEVLTMTNRTHTPMNLPERRCAEDRRATQTSPFSPVSFRGTRRIVRREEDRRVHYYVDLYGRDELLIFILILILAVADAFLTLLLVGRGAAELNYVMDYYLRLGPIPFLVVKYLLTAVGLVWLLICKNYPFFGGKLRVKTIMIGLAVTYLVLVTYELLLLRHC